MAQKLKKHIEKPSKPFTQVPNWMINGMGELSPLAFRVYLILYSQGPNFNPTHAFFTRRLRNRGSPIGEATIKRATEELKTAGYLEIKKVGYNSYEWHIYDRPYHKDNS